MPRLTMGHIFLPAIIVVLAISIGLYEPRFWSPLNLSNVARGISFLMIIASGQMLVLLLGGFDLSVGAVASMSSVVMAAAVGAVGQVLPDQTLLAIFLGCLLALSVGILVGVFNGILVGHFKVSAFMVTLGTMSVVTGISLLITNGVPIYGLPEAFTTFGQSRLFGLPAAFYVMLAISLTLFVTLNATRCGRYFYAIGSNEQAARNSGIATLKYIVASYALCSLLAAVTGLLLTARFGSGEATLGDSFMLQSITAAVIGGVSLRGGIGRVERVFFGVVFLQLMTNGMNLVQVDTKIQTIILGAILILAVGLEQLKGRGQR